MKRAFCHLTDGIDVGQLRNAVLLQKNKPSKTMKRVQKEKKKEKASRCVVWKQATLYECMRPGVAFESQQALVDCARQGNLTEDMLYIFKHKDENVTRNSMVPKYEGVFFCKATNEFIRSQKSHLAQAYNNSHRVDCKLIWSVFEDDETPYWVDRYAFCRQGQNESKQKYESTKKQKQNN